jgi:hypothetical protein
VLLNLQAMQPETEQTSSGRRETQMLKIRGWRHSNLFRLITIADQLDSDVPWSRFWEATSTRGYAVMCCAVVLHCYARCSLLLPATVVQLLGKLYWRYAYKNNTFIITCPRYALMRVLARQP